MKIKLAFLEKDAGYLSRIVNVFSTKYADHFQIYSFTDQEIAMSTLESSKIEVFVASDAFDIDVAKLPKRCSFAYFVDSADIEMLNGQQAICKFQKAELICKQLLSMYSENSSNVFGLRFGDNISKVIAFQPVSGGVGASSAAAACAVNMAAKGKKVLYLNIERFGTSDVFFTGDGQYTMHDLIYALKSKKSNLSMKLESFVRRSSTGVYFYSKSENALDMMELSSEEILRLISELNLTGGYDYIILDMDFSVDKNALEINRQVHAIVWVGDGSEVSNTKLYRAYNAISTIEEKADAPITHRMSLIYNKFSNKTCKMIEGIELTNIGGAPRYEHATTTQVIEQLAALNLFEKLM